ncbi:Kinesin light chain 3 [Colletotrichum fructicola]|nr:Kinesin light chain 3 [Colletotrichum fructicola]
MTSHSRPRRREDFQVAVVCALPLEYNAAVFACEEVWDKGETRLGNAPGDYNTYATGRMGGHDIVLLLLPNMGKVSAASAAASLRSSYHGIRLAILTGICGGVPGVGTNNEVFLGDVIISKSIVQKAQQGVLVPYNANPDFVGRSETLHQMKRLFGHELHVDQAARPRPRIALYGLGGVGKTQIALAYVFWMQYAHPDVSVFWVHASNADRFRQAFSTIAQECGIPGYDDPKADMLMLVKTWLENGVRGRWLMVIDNADDTQLFFPSLSDSSITNTHMSANTQGGLGRYIPECGHGCVLITTRNKQTASRLVRGKAIIEVGDMSDNESSQLLHRILHDDISAKEVSILSARLEHLPLALAQAAAFIQENSVSIDRYLQLLGESNDSLVDQLSEPFQAIGRDSETPHALTATWIVSFNQIQQQDPLASDLLSFACLLDRQGIPENLVVGFCDQRKRRGQQISTSKMLKALGTLKGFSLVSEAKDNAIDMHRLVQLVTRKWLDIHSRLAGCIEDALEVVSDLYPYGRYESRQLCQDYLPHANAVLQHGASISRKERLARASLLLNMTGYFLCYGQWAQAEQVVAQSLKLRENILGEEHPSTLTSMANLASTYSNQGRWKEAEELEVRVMETRKRVPRR